jgi:hypothetical protein
MEATTAPFQRMLPVHELKAIFFLQAQEYVRWNLFVSRGESSEDSKVGELSEDSYIGELSEDSKVFVESKFHFCVI